jgi:EpsI family protein
MTDEPAPTAPYEFSRRHMIMGATMLGVAGLAYARMPQNITPPIAIKAFNDMVPRSIGLWSMDANSEFVLPPPDSLSERLYDNLITRAYVKPDEPPVLMLIAYNNRQDGILQLHRPEICYPVAGFKLTETRIVDVATSQNRILKARSFTASAVTRTEHVLYWTRLGSYMPTSWVDQRVAVIKENLNGIEPDGLMVRLSVVSDDAARSLETMTRFVADFNQSLKPAPRQLLFGK